MLPPDRHPSSSCLLWSHLPAEAPQSIQLTTLWEACILFRDKPHLRTVNSIVAWPWAIQLGSYQRTCRPGSQKVYRSCCICTLGERCLYLVSTAIRLSIGSHLLLAMFALLCTRQDFLLFPFLPPTYVCSTYIFIWQLPLRNYDIPCTTRICKINTRSLWL